MRLEERRGLRTGPCPLALEVGFIQEEEEEEAAKRLRSSSQGGQRKARNVGLTEAKRRKSEAKWGWGRAKGRTRAVCVGKVPVGTLGNVGGGQETRRGRLALQAEPHLRLCAPAAVPATAGQPTNCGLLSSLRTALPAASVRVQGLCPPGLLRSKTTWAQGGTRPSPPVWPDVF